MRKTAHSTSSQKAFIQSVFRILRRFAASSAAAVLFVPLLLCLMLAGCKMAGAPGQETSSDVMYTSEKSDAKIDVYVYEGSAFTTDYGYEIPLYDRMPEEGAFARVTADVKYLNGGVAGYVNYPEIKSVNGIETISPLDLNLPSLEEKIYGLARIGEYAEGDVFLYEGNRIAVWKDGKWIYKYDRVLRAQDGLQACVRNGVSEETVRNGMQDGVILCESYFVLPSSKKE